MIMNEQTSRVKRTGLLGYHNECVLIVTSRVYESIVKVSYCHHHQTIVSLLSRELGKIAIVEEAVDRDIRRPDVSLTLDSHFPTSSNLTHFHRPSFLFSLFFSSASF